MSYDAAASWIWPVGQAARADRDARAGDPAPIRCPFSGKEVPQQMVVDDDGGHLRRCQVRVVDTLDPLKMILGGQGSSENLLAAARRQEDHSVTQIHHSHPSPVIEPPPMAYCRRNRHLAIRGHKELGGYRHFFSVVLGKYRFYQMLPGEVEYALVKASQLEF